MNPSPVRAIAASVSLHRARSRASRSRVATLGQPIRPDLRSTAWRTARSISARWNVVGHELARPRAHVERVDDLHADRLHGRVADVEPELGERLGDAVQDADLGGRPHLEHRRVARRLVVEHDARRSGLLRPASPAGAGRSAPARRGGPRSPARRRGPAAGRRVPTPSRTPSWGTSTRNCEAAMPSCPSCGRRSAPGR